MKDTTVWVDMFATVKKAHYETFIVQKSQAKDLLYIVQAGNESGWFLDVIFPPHQKRHLGSPKGFFQKKDYFCITFMFCRIGKSWEYHFYRSAHCIVGFFLTDKGVVEL